MAEETNIKYTKEDILGLLTNGEQTKKLAMEIKKSTVGDTIYLRGLIELSNICVKECYYCGIRASNKKAERYELDDDGVLWAARYAYENGYGNVAIQAGERTSSRYTDRIARLIDEIKSLSNGELGITLSLGEQSRQTLKKWRDSGADRYLLRIETSDRDLYSTLHPNDENHSYDRRVDVLRTLREFSYQVGTGVMIGLPGQTLEHLANDLLFFKEEDIDMCGMGPYLVHRDTPLYKVAQASKMLSEDERFELTILMIASLRCIMPSVNIAATTAMQAIRPDGRTEALKYGANVLMPNITPVTDISNYKLYENKPIREGSAGEGDHSLFAELEKNGFVIGFNEQGNSLHYARKIKGYN